MMMNAIIQLYKELLAKHGPQGWWPLLELHTKKGNARGVNPTKTGSIQGYHPNDYSYPKTRKQQFEICVGAILTQNTNWPNVEKALINLQKKKLLNAKRILNVDENLLKLCIRPAGYYNQKAKKLKIFSQFFIMQKNKIPSRNQLLTLWGVGPETADSILLCVYKQPEFVVDMYTKRLLLKRKIIDETATYDDIKQLIEKNLPKKFALYQEFHALLVEEGKH